MRELGSPAWAQQSPNFVDRHASWTVPGSVSHALSYVEHHAPPGCRFDASGTSSGGIERTVRVVGCDAQPTAYAAEPQVLVEVLATGRGTAVRVDAEAIWVPARPTYSQIVHPSSVHLVVERDHEEPTVRRRLGHSGADQLAGVLNRLPVFTPGTYSCPAGFAGDEDDLAFRTAAGTVRSSVELSGCAGVRVTVPGHRSVYLSINSSVDETVRHLLRLPQSYRR